MIYVITHKIFDDTKLDKNIYRVLHVGTNPDAAPDYLRDDTGDSIAEKNSNYCELTGLYWMWKNGKEKKTGVTGLVHYRRYFTTKMGDLLYTYFHKKPEILSGEKISKTLKKYDIILPAKTKIMRTIREYYGDGHWAEDLDITREALQETHPECVDAYDIVMKAHAFYYANMMICRKELLDEYARWLFEIMDVLETKIDLSKYDKDEYPDYQKRIFGFLSERLLQVWVKYKGLKVKEYPAFNTERRRLTFFEVNRNRMEKLLGKLRGK